MAVPPLGAQIIIDAVLKSLAGIWYPSIAAKWPEELLAEKDAAGRNREWATDQRPSL